MNSYIIYVLVDSCLDLIDSNLVMEFTKPDLQLRKGRDFSVMYCKNRLSRVETVYNGCVIELGDFYFRAVGVNQWGGFSSRLYSIDGVVDIVWE